MFQDYLKMAMTLLVLLGSALAGWCHDFEVDGIYYNYNGDYEDSYKIGEQIVYDGTLTVSDVRIDRSKCSAMYMITDIYEKEYFTPVIPD